MSQSFEPLYDDRGLIPVVAQDFRTGRLLMLAWMNAEAFARTRREGQVWYWSRSRGALWRKGETSGHTQTLVELRLDCDRDAVLVLVDQIGPACHTNAPSCFFADGDGTDLGEAPPGNMLDRLERLLLEKKENASADASYTRRLLDAGAPKINAKILEEAGELTRAIESEGDDRVVSEMADVLYHAMVGLVHRGIGVERVLSELGRRFGVSGLAEKASRVPPNN